MTSVKKARELMDQFCKAFGVEAKQRAFKKLALRKWVREGKSFSLVLGLQKSQWAPSLYVNCGVVYEKLGGSAKLNSNLRRVRGNLGSRRSMGRNRRRQAQPA